MHTASLHHVLASTLLLLILLVFSRAVTDAEPEAASGLRFAISFPATIRDEPLDGRLLLMLSTRHDGEPRFQIHTGVDTQQIFGTEVEGLEPGEPALIDDRALGFPRDSLAQIPPGEYTVQALVHLYETFHRADGHVVKLPMDDGEGQQWNRSPGNLYSSPQRLSVSPETPRRVEIRLDRVIPPLTSPRDTEYIKYVRVRSRLLSEFWGRPMDLGAVVLLPSGFDQHPEARYPVMYYQGHFDPGFQIPVGLRETPPGPDLRGSDRTMAEYSHRFYRDWTSGRIPRMLIVSIQHPNPYYDDSYGVNSENLGPYGEAIVTELIPFVEETFRGMGEPWARALFGGSTGGWIALAEQVFYPDTFNGAWCFCPDPVDFRAFQQVNIYEDENAYWTQGPWKKVPRIDQREVNGDIRATMEDANRLELVLGTRGRSGEQWDIWQAVYSPVGNDGYPRPIWDKRTGVLDPEVAQYWREHYDLRHILERDWSTLGPKLVGKIHITMGDMDNFYLDRAVQLLEGFLEGTKNPGKGPYYAGTIEYGDGHGHCYSGDPSSPTRIGGLTSPQRILPQVEAWMLSTAPPGADTKSWRY